MDKVLTLGMACWTCWIGTQGFCLHRGRGGEEVLVMGVGQRERGGKILMMVTLLPVSILAAASGVRLPGSVEDKPKNVEAVCISAEQDD